MLLVWLLLACLGLLLVMLAIPVELACVLRYGEGRQAARGRLVWLFGLVRIDLRRGGATARERPARPKAGKAGGGPRLTQRMLGVLLRERVAQRLLQLALALLRRIRVRQLSLDLCLGLDDPADTGRLWGLVGPLTAVLPSSPATRIAIAPDFSDERFELDGVARIAFIPLQLLLVVLGCLLSPGTLRTLHAIRVAAR